MQTAHVHPCREWLLLLHTIAVIYYRSKTYLPAKDNIFFWHFTSLTCDKYLNNPSPVTSLWNASCLENLTGFFYVCLYKPLWCWDGSKRNWPVCHADLLSVSRSLSVPLSIHLFILSLNVFRFVVFRGAGFIGFLGLLATSPFSTKRLCNKAVTKTLHYSWNVSSSISHRRVILDSISG